MDTLDNILLYTENISKNFQGIKAVNNVNFKIYKNEIRALIGPNGAGKTTTFYIIVGLVKPDTGSIILDKLDVSNLPSVSKTSVSKVTSVAVKLLTEPPLAPPLRYARKAGVFFNAALLSVKEPDPSEVIMALSPPSASMFTLSLLVIYAPIILCP